LKTVNSSGVVSQITNKVNELKCYKRLIGLKETTKPKDNLVKLEGVYKWNKCQAEQFHQYKIRLG